MRSAFLCVCMVLSAVTFTSAQWAKQRDPKVPVTRDGKPILGGTRLNETDYRFAAVIYPLPQKATGGAQSTRAAKKSKPRKKSTRRKSIRRTSAKKSAAKKRTPKRRATKRTARSKRGRT